MTGKDSQLRKENQQLRNEVAELKKHLEKLSVEIDNRTEESDRAAAMAVIHRQRVRPNQLNLYLHSTMSSRHSGNMHPKR